jgi:putative membrane protein
MTAANTLPHITALLNMLTVVFLLVAFRRIKAGNRDGHRQAMLSAVGVSFVFLVIYITYHFMAPIFVFAGQGWVRPFYYFLLISHVLLAMVAAPLVLITLYRGWKGDFVRHKKIARVTFPLWLYVSASGIAVYVMLYHLYAPKV